MVPSGNQTTHMKKTKSVIIALALVAFAFTASAQRHPANTAPIASTKVEAPSAVKGKATVAQSHIKSLGTIGVTDRYEVVQVKVRGLDTPNIAGFVIYDRETDTISAAQTAGAPGLGVAIVNGSSYVAGNYLFGSKLKPDQTSVSAGGGNSSATSNATGGSGGNANATGGNGNGGAGGAGGSGGSGGAGGSGGGGWVPPGHQDGHPGNGPKK